MHELNYKIEDIKTVVVTSKTDNSEEVYQRINDQYFSCSFYDQDVYDHIKCPLCGTMDIDGYSYRDGIASCPICDMTPSKELGTMIDENELIELVEYYYNDCNSYMVNINQIQLP